jgi:hypothetical protein
MTDLSFYVPHISRDGLDAEASAFLKEYCPEALREPMCVPIEQIAVVKMKLTVLEYHLSEDLSILGQMCFTDGKAEIYDPEEDEYREIIVKAGTMIIDPDTYARRNLGSKRNTIAHECFHWHRHKIYHLKAAESRNETNAAYRCPCPTQERDERNISVWTDEDWMEWQANNVAPRILMPIETVEQVFHMMDAESQKNPFVAKGLRSKSQWIIEQTAGFYKVSKKASEIRLTELRLLS